MQVRVQLILCIGFSILCACDSSSPTDETTEVVTSDQSPSAERDEEIDLLDAFLEMDVALESPTPPPLSLGIEVYDPIPLVDPLIATGGIGAEIASVSPGASAPMGLTLVGPDTRHLIYLPPYHCAGYHYPDTHIKGFSHTHAHGMGVVDYGGISLMPRASWDETFRDPVERQAPFDHSTEWATPGQYGVQLDDDETLVEIVATPRGAHHRYQFIEGVSPAVILDLGDHLPSTEILASEVSVNGSDVTAYQLLKGQYSGRFGGAQHHAALRFDPAPLSILTWADDEEISTQEEVTGRAVGLVLLFPEGTQQVDVRVALSFVDAEGAWKNLEAELPNWRYDDRVAEVQMMWRDRLGRLRVRGAERDRRRFTTAHYHSLLMPSIHSDIDGRYRGLDQEIHQTNTRYFSDLSLWDTFRTLHSFYLLVHPDLQLDILQSLIQMGADGGDLPRWPLAHGYTGGMVGTPATQLFAEAYLKGFTEGWSVERAFELALAQTNGESEHARRGGGEAYRELGWVPADEAGGSVSRTLEFSWSDFSLARWAEALGRPEVEYLDHLANNWANHWNPDRGFLMGRNRDGQWVDLSGEYNWDPVFVEGNAWHYLWYVPYDVEEMIAVQHQGDKDDFLVRYQAYWDRVYVEPDDVLPDNDYWHGNEPVMHYAWLGSLIGARDITIEASHHILRTRYGHGPADGLDGNDDSGTLSAWYLWASMGIYPVAGTDRYALGAPIFNRIEIDQAGGTLVIDASEADWDVHPHRTWVGSELLHDSQLTHQQLVRGLIHDYE